MQRKIPQLPRLFWLVTGILLIAGGSATANLITNGNFETGDFTGWTVTPAGSESFILVGTLPMPHDTNGALFGAFGPGFDSISQTFATTPGTLYDLSFFYEIGNTPKPPDNAFQVFFNGVLVFNNANAIPGFGTFSFLEPATGTITTLEFQGRNLPDFDFLDNVSVTESVPDTGSTLALLALALAALVGARRFRSIRLASSLSALTPTERN